MLRGYSLLMAVLLNTNINEVQTMQAYNFITLVKYNGQNAGLVGNGDLNAFATFNQVSQAGYKVNKGAKAISIFCGYFERLNKKTGENETVPTYARVFDIKDTSAYQDTEFVNWLKTEAVIVENDRVTGLKILAGAMA